VNDPQNLDTIAERKVQDETSIEPSHTEYT